MRKLFFCVALVVMAMTSCIKIDVKGEPISCDKGCPINYHCAADNRCWPLDPLPAGNTTGGTAGASHGGEGTVPSQVLAPSASTSSISAQPTSVVANGQSLVTITVVVRDAAGNAIPNAQVFLSSSGTGNLVSQPEPTDASGRARGRVAATTAETKVINAALGGAASVVTITTTVEFTQPKPVNLVFATQPGNSAPHTVFGSSVLVKAVDAANLPFTGPSIPIQIALVDTNPATGAVLTGSTSVSTNQGFAKFDTLSIDKPGVGFKLVATYDTLIATSSPFTVSDSLPSPPTGLTAMTSKASTIVLSWTSPDVDHFDILRTVNSGSESRVATVPGTTKVYVDSNLLAGTYHYFVTAVSSVGESGRSSEASADAHQELCVANNAANGGLGSVTVISGDTRDGSLGAIRSFTRSLGGPFGLAVNLSGPRGPTSAQIFVVNNGVGNNVLSFPRTEDAAISDDTPASLTGPASALNTPTSVAYDATHDEIVVVSTGNNTVLGFDGAATGTSAPKWSIVGAATRLSVPEGLAVDGANGYVYVGNFANNEILTFRRSDCPDVGSNCAPYRTWTNNAGSVAGPVGMYFGGDTLFVANQGGSNVAAFDGASSIATGSSSPVASRIVTSSSFTSVNGVVANASSLFVANDKSVILLPRAAVGSNSGTTIAPNGLNGATGIAFCN